MNNRNNRPEIIKRRKLIRETDSRTSSQSLSASKQSLLPEEALPPTASSVEEIIASMAVPAPPEHLDIEDIEAISLPPASSASAYSEWQQELREIESEYYSALWEELLYD